MDEDHSRNTVRYQKSLRIQAFESLDGFKMYYMILMIGTSVSSLHRESSDSLILVDKATYLLGMTNIMHKTQN